MSKLISKGLRVSLTSFILISLIKFDLNLNILANLTANLYLLILSFPETLKIPFIFLFIRFCRISEKSFIELE